MLRDTFRKIYNFYQIVHALCALCNTFMYILVYFCYTLLNTAKYVFDDRKRQKIQDIAK